MSADRVESLSVESLVQMIERANDDLQLAADDVFNRSAITSKRKITMVIEIEPAVDPATGENFPEINWSVSRKLPGNSGRVGRAYYEGKTLKINRPVRNSQQGHLFAETNDNVTTLKTGEK